MNLFDVLGTFLLERALELASLRDKTLHRGAIWVGTLVSEHG
jgi:hypothetical protein